MSSSQDPGVMLKSIRNLFSDTLLKELEIVAKQALATLSEARTLSAAVNQLTFQETGEDPGEDEEEQIVGQVRMAASTFDNGIITVEVEPDSQLLTYMLLRQWAGCEQALRDVAAWAEYSAALVKQLESTEQKPTC